MGICSECPLEPNHYRFTGVRKTKYLVVSKRPANRGCLNEYGMGLAEKRILLDALEKYDFDLEDFTWFNGIRCLYNESSILPENRRKIKKTCKNWTSRVASKVKPDVIIAVGAEAAEQVMGKATAVKKNRGKVIWSERQECWVYIVLDPTMVLMYPQHKATFFSDIRTLKKLEEHDFDAKSLESESVESYKIVYDLSEIIEAEPEFLAFDIETNRGLRWHDDDNTIATMQFSFEEGKAYCLPWDHPESKLGTRGKKRVMNQLIQVLNNPRINLVGQNMKFDAVFVLHKLGIRIKIDQDTLMMYTLLDENCYDKSLSSLIKRCIPDMAGYCVTPETRILTSDMKWVQARELSVGDKLVGFEEYPRYRKNRRMKVSEVIGVKSITKRCFEFVMKSGRTITVSDNHQFLKRRYEHGGGAIKWAQARDLCVGDGLKTFPFAQPDDRFEDGWMSGFLDGEGWCQNVDNSGFRVGYAQMPGDVLDKALSMTPDTATILPDNSEKKNPCMNVTVNGWNSHWMLQKYRPSRLIKSEKWVGTSLPRDCWDEIVSRRFVGEKTVLAIETSTHTFIAEGICSHNSDDFDGRVDKGNLWKEPLKDVAIYGMGDTDATLRLFNYLYPKIRRDKRLWAHYRRVSIPTLNAFRDIELRGMYINKKNLKKFERKLAAWVEAEKNELLGMIAPSILRKHARIKQGSKYVDGLRFTRDAFVRDILFEHEDGLCLEPIVFTKGTKNLDDEYKVPSVSSKDHLPYFFDESPFVQRLAHWIQANRMLSTNVRKFEDKYIYGDKIYPTYSLTTAVTGRSSSSDPNAQNFPARGPNAKGYRSMFTAPSDDYVVMGADLSQAELRIAGDMANDPTLIEIYNTGGDVHLSTAMDVMGVDTLEELFKLGKDEVKLARFKAKAVNFGFLYGMWYVSFIGYAKTQYNLDFTEEEAEALDHAYFSRYSNLKQWHKKVIQFARRNKYVRSYTGRIRHLPAIDSPDSFIASESERQAINSPVQETASSLGLMAMSWLNQNIDPDFIKIVGFVHDAIYSYVPKKYIVYAAKTIKRAMESIPIEEWFDVKMKIAMEADVSFGVNTGVMHEMSGLSLDSPYDLAGLWAEEDASGNPVEFDLPKQYRPKNKGRIIVPEYLKVSVD